MEVFTEGNIVFSEVMDMKKHWQLCVGIISALGMMVLILDAKTAMAAGLDGIQLCIQTLIPSLLPFFFMSSMLTQSLVGKKLRILAPLERILRIPQGSGGIVLISLLGGYPVGAQCIGQSLKERCLSHEDARRMIGFCSNAGPSFLFGIGAVVFPEIWMCWLLWGIHIAAMLLTGVLTPGMAYSPAGPMKEKNFSVSASLKGAVQSMGMVCGWVVLFRILLAFCQRWFLWLLPEAGQIFVAGILEIANGSCSLPQLPDIGSRFLLWAIFLSFGGVCVALQTYSVAADIDVRLYLPGKLTQAAISYLLALPCCAALFQTRSSLPAVIAAAAICVIYYIYGRKTEKNSSNYRYIGV